MIPTPEQAWELLCEYNEGDFHRKHGRIVGDVLRWYANELGYGDEADFWQAVGILHDLDFEQWPKQHCTKEQELLRERGIEPDFIPARYVAEGVVEGLLAQGPVSGVKMLLPRAAKAREVLPDELRKAGYSDEVIAEAKDMGAQLIVSHHPLTFEGLKSLRSPEEVARIRGKSVEEIVG